jgi:hypothetical protein
VRGRGLPRAGSRSLRHVVLLERLARRGYWRRFQRNTVTDFLCSDQRITYLMSCAEDICLSMLTPVAWDKGVDQEKAEIQALIQAGSVQLPDPATCRAGLGSDPDPWELWKCRIAQEVAEESDGDLAKGLRAANEEIAKGDATANISPRTCPRDRSRHSIPEVPACWYIETESSRPSTVSK